MRVYPNAMSPSSAKKPSEHRCAGAGTERTAGPMQRGRAGVAYTNDDGTITSGVTVVTLSDQIEHAVLTDVGVRRPHNQDNCIVQTASDEEHFEQHGHLYVVADGMGAHAV